MTKFSKKFNNQKTAGYAVSGSSGIFPGLLLVPAIKGRGQKHQDDTQPDNGEYEIESKHIFDDYDFNDVIQRLINQNNEATIAPPTIKEISNLSRTTGKTTEATNTVPKSEQISESLENKSLLRESISVFSIVLSAILSTAGAFIQHQEIAPAGAGFIRAQGFNVRE